MVWDTYLEHGPAYLGFKGWPDEAVLFEKHQHAIRSLNHLSEWGRLEIYLLLTCWTKVIFTLIEGKDTKPADCG